MAKVTSEELGEYGGDRKSGKTEDQVDNVNLIESKGGNSQNYLLSRLKRDAPEIAEDYFSGKYPSVRQAAIAAGIVKQQSPYEKAIKTMQKLDSEQDLVELRHEIDCRLDKFNKEV